MKSFYLILLSILFVHSSFGASRCLRAFEQPLSDWPVQGEARDLVNQRRIQEAYWEIKHQSDVNLARRLRSYIEQELRTLAELPYEPEQWDLFSDHSQHMNESFLFSLSGFQALLKFTEGAVNERVTFQVADLVNVRAPITVDFEIDGQKAMAQVFIPNTITMAQAYRESFPIGQRQNRHFFIDRPQDLPIDHLLFGEMVMASDTGDANYITLPGSGDWLSRLVSIDHEQTLEGNPRWLPPVSWESQTTQTSFDFVLSLSREFPKMHEALMSPEVTNQIISIVDSRPETKDSVPWVRDWIEYYQDFASQALKP